MEAVLGRIIALYRFPVKSMQGEQLKELELSRVCVVGDRAYAVVDLETGKKLSAKRYPALMTLRARLSEPPRAGHQMPSAVITLPDGRELRTGESATNTALSDFFGHAVEVRACDPEPPSADDLKPANSFFDGAPVHLLTTATLERLRETYPTGDFDALRFRPNVVLEVAAGPSFAEDAWLGGMIAVGNVRLRVADKCPRCAMTTWSQPGLPQDPEILKTALSANSGNVGVYLEVLSPGTVKVGDSVAAIGTAGAE